jgi:hypothetical protein
MSGFEIGDRRVRHSKFITMSTGLFLSLQIEKQRSTRGVRMSVRKGETVDDPAPTAPIPPDLEACCGSGCNPCIFDVYEAARERYLAELAAWEKRQAKRKSGGAR